MAKATRQAVQVLQQCDLNPVGCELANLTFTVLSTVFGTIWFWHLVLGR